MEQIATNDYAPQDLVNDLLATREVLEVEVSVSEDTREVNVYVKLRFWHRLKSVLYSDHGHGLVAVWGSKIIQSLPEGTALKIKLII